MTTDICNCTPRPEFYRPHCKRPSLACEPCKKECGVCFTSTTIPANLGSSASGQAYAPKNGMFYNTIVKYAADGAIFIYDSAGVPTPLANVVLSVNEQTGEVVLAVSDLENDAQYQTLEEVTEAIEAATSTKVEQTVFATTVANLENQIQSNAGNITNLQGQVQQAMEDITTKADESALLDEVEDRENADTALQSQIDAISASSDVKDIVGTYADLEAYDTTTLGNNDIIKVLQDETQNDATTYYRYSTSTQSFTLIGSEGPYYTKAEADVTFIPETDLVQATGSSTTNVMSQKAVTDALTGLSYTAGTGIDITGSVISADQTVMATKSYVDGRVIQNAGAPTTATVGTVGQLLEDTTNGKLYQCTAVDTESDPAVYTWVIMTSGYTIVSLTQAEYDALSSYDPSTIYIITEA